MRKYNYQPTLEYIMTINQNIDNSHVHAYLEHTITDVLVLESALFFEEYGEDLEDYIEQCNTTYY